MNKLLVTTKEGKYLVNREEYIAPAMELVECDDMLLLAGSSITSTGDVVIDWGGYDNEGTLIPQ